MRIVAALGGNALLRRGDPLDAAGQVARVRAAVRGLAALADGNELIVTHGNGPQVGCWPWRRTTSSRPAGCGACRCRPAPWVPRRRRPAASPSSAPAPSR